MDVDLQVHFDASGFGPALERIREGMSTRVKFNLFTDYAIRALMYLTWHRQRTVTAEEIARFYGISRDHIVKVIQELSRQGYVQARRGRGGGSILAREPVTITVSEVITTFEGPPAFLDCLRTTGVCAIEPSCRLKKTLLEAQRRMIEFLGEVTIAHLAGEGEPETIPLTLLNHKHQSNGVVHPSADIQAKTPVPLNPITGSTPLNVDVHHPGARRI